MNLQTAKAHLRMLGFTQLNDDRGNPNLRYFTNNKGMVIQNGGTEKPYWNSSLLCSTGCTKPAKKLAEFLNGH